MKIREFGSDYNLVLGKRSENVFLDRSDIELFFSGRSALFKLVEWGIAHDGWERILFPSYYCHEVVQFLRSLPIHIDYYEYNPFLDSSIDFHSIETSGHRNVFVNVDYFGTSKISHQFSSQVVVVDDLTHNFDGIFSSTADFCFGSLRKILPIPCGGFLYSPHKKILPTGVSNDYSEDVSIMRLTAMFLKKRYLNGEVVDKGLFRRLFLDSEAKFSDLRTVAKIPTSSLSVLPFINVRAIL